MTWLVSRELIISLDVVARQELPFIGIGQLFMSHRAQCGDGFAGSVAHLVIARCGGITPWRSSVLLDCLDCFVTSFLAMTGSIVLVLLDCHVTSRHASLAAKGFSP